ASPHPTSHDACGPVNSADIDHTVSYELPTIAAVRTALTNGAGIAAALVDQLTDSTYRHTAISVTN
ncbi:MAG: hypothetical protein ACPHDT_12970, partial [Acidimicrobiales bacterium]